MYSVYSLACYSNHICPFQWLGIAKVLGDRATVNVVVKWYRVPVSSDNIWTRRQYSLVPNCHVKLSVKDILNHGSFVSSTRLLHSQELYSKEA